MPVLRCFDACAFLILFYCFKFKAGTAVFGNSSHIRTYQLPYAVHDDGNDATG